MFALFPGGGGKTERTKRGKCNQGRPRVVFSFEGKLSGNHDEEARKSIQCFRSKLFPRKIMYTIARKNFELFPSLSCRLIGEHEKFALVKGVFIVRSSDKLESKFNMFNDQLSHSNVVAC